MKTRCWVCGILALVLFYACARAEDKAEPKLPLTKGTVVRVTDKKFVVKSSNEKVGEVAYPLAEVSQHVTLDSDVLKRTMAEEKTKDKYFRPKAWRPADVQPGSMVKVQYGQSNLTDGDSKVVENGNYYQITVVKLPEAEKDTDRPKKKD